MGSLYLLLAGGDLEERLDTPRNDHVPSPDSVISMDADDLERRSVNAARESSEPDQRSTVLGRSFSSPGETSGRSRMAKLGRSTTMTTTTTLDVGNRRSVAKILERFSDITHPSAERFNYDAFKHGIAAGWPTLPGEEERNPKLNQTRKQFNESRDVDGSVAPMRPSRAASFTGSANSIRHPSPSPSHSPRDASFTFERTSSELHSISTPPGAFTRGRPRRDTLEVPTISHGLQTSLTFVEAVPDTPSSPTIVISKMFESEK